MKRLLKKGFLLSTCKGFETLLGLSFALLMVRNFGAGPQTDALFGATVLAVGIFHMIPTMMSQVIIPTLVMDDCNQEERRHFLGSICCISALVGLFFFGLSLLMPWVILAVSAPGLQAAEAYPLATRYSVALAPVYPCTMLFGLLQGILHAERRFFEVEAGQLIWKAAPVIAIFFTGQYGLLIVACGYSIGAAIRLGVVLWAFGWTRLAEISPCLPRRKHFPARSFRLLRTEGLIVVLDWTTELVIRALASLLPVGGLSLFNYAERFCRSLPGSVLRGFGVVLLPDLAKLTARRGPEEKKLIVQACIFSVVAGVFAGIALYIAAPFVVMLFSQYSPLDAGALVDMGQSIRAFSPYILFLLLVMVLQARFFLQNQIRSIAVLSMIHAAVLILCWWFSGGGSPQSLAFAMTAAIASKGIVSLMITKRYFSRAKDTTCQIINN